MRHNISLQQLIALLPLLIVGLTVVILMLCIAWKRSHFFSIILTTIGLSLSLLSLWLVVQNGLIDIVPLMRIDSFSVLYTGIVLFSSLAISVIAYIWLSIHLREDNCDEFYLLVLIATAGGVILSSANHLAMLFLGIELISLPVFGMVGYTFRQKRSLEASIKYTVLSAVASSFLMFGMALIYAETGQLSFIGIGQVLIDAVLKKPFFIVGIGMMIVGVGFKLSLVPFHLWTPDVYQGAPASVSAFLATASKISIFAAVMRLFFYVPITNNEILKAVLAIISFSSMLFGSLMALNQSNIKRILGYSSISHLGYLLIGIITLQTNELALETLGIYLSGYFLANLGAFGVISLMSTTRSHNEKEDTDELSLYRGLFWYKPILSVSLTVMILSLAGIPVTLGFISKFYIIVLAVNSHLIWLTVAVVTSSVISLFYYLRIIINLYLPPLKSLHRDIFFSCNSRIMIDSGEVLLLIVSLLLLGLGLYPQPLITLVQLAKLLS